MTAIFSYSGKQTGLQKILRSADAPKIVGGAVGAATTALLEIGSTYHLPRLIAAGVPPAACGGVIP